MVQVPISRHKQRRDSTFGVQQPLDAQLVFGDSEGMLHPLHGGESLHLLPAQRIRPATKPTEKWASVTQTETLSISVLKYLRLTYFLGFASELEMWDQMQGPFYRAK